MSLLDDENILIEKTRESVDFSLMLDSVFGDYKITDSIYTKSGNDLFNSLPCFEEYEWMRYSDRFAMVHISTRRVVLAIDFDKILQYYSPTYEYEYMLRVIIYTDYCTFSIHDYFKSLFKLDDKVMWECIHNTEDVLRHTIYKKLKCN
jgi:hypothetical protein